MKFVIYYSRSLNYPNSNLKNLLFIIKNPNFCRIEHKFLLHIKEFNFCISSNYVMDKSCNYQQINILFNTSKVQLSEN